MPNSATNFRVERNLSFSASCVAADGCNLLEFDVSKSLSHIFPEIPLQYSSDTLACSRASHWAFYYIMKEREREYKWFKLCACLDFHVCFFFFLICAVPLHECLCKSHVKSHEQIFFGIFFIQIRRVGRVNIKNLMLIAKLVFIYNLITICNLQFTIRFSFNSQL